MLRNNQTRAIQKTIENQFESGVHFQATGVGKCQSKGTPVIMYNGRVKKIENVKIGDVLMSDESYPTQVLSIHRGIGRMYNVYQHNGDPYCVNDQHILCLKKNNSIVEINVLDYLELSSQEKKKYKGYKTPIEFDKPTIKHSFIVGFLCGYFNINFRKEFKYSCRKNRLELLYGLFRSKGKIISKNRIEIIIKNINLYKNTIYISRSLGFECTMTREKIILQKNSNLTTDIKISFAGIKEYYGITLDGNGRYILGDFTVTHNSWIGLQLMIEFHKMYPTENILWLCEYKTILKYQFIRYRLREMGFGDLLKIFHILEFYEKKNKNWVESINATRFWNKPALIIINRAFLTSKDNYKKIGVPISFIIHDESHTIVNQSTRDFYNFMLEKNPMIKCIGFSATPCLDYKPFHKIISSYSIYDAFVDNVIVPPKIVWIKSMNCLMNKLELGKTIRMLIKELPYKKIIVWCGLIELCNTLAKLWKPLFKDYFIAIDTSKNSNDEFEEFQNRSSKAILFCACKHREGSDIKNLDGCVFMDGVTNRHNKTFVQCLGRVLRIDPLHHKKYGLIIDVEVKSPIKIFKRMNEYLTIGNKDFIFPWKFEYQVFSFSNQKRIKVHYLTMQKENMYNSTASSMIQTECSIEDLLEKFIRKIPETDVYKNRLERELRLIKTKNLVQYLLQAVKILEITRGIPHITRGSCGSSLVCYMLGISHVDPILYNIRFSRFLNEFRDTLPDIDFDFPHNLRDEVFLQLELLWPGKVARISNHNFYHTKSALRQAIRNAGIHKFIPKNGLHKEIQTLDKETQEYVKEESQNLENTFKGYSLHCGGIVFYPEGIPDDLLLKNKKYNILKQIHTNKEDISKQKKFKIDILSSRALSQLFEGMNHEMIHFETETYDPNVFQSLSDGNNLGITFAESPLMRKAFMMIKPKTIFDIAICLGIVRPAARDAFQCFTESKLENSPVIFDDDAIDIITQNISCDEGVADKIRRKFSKSTRDGVDELKKYGSYSKDSNIVNQLKNLKKYSFCKSHALSYAQLIYKLAELKYYHPQKFWETTLKHCHSSYRKWVHYYEARLHNVIIQTQSIYAQNRKNTMDQYSLYDQLRKYGFWKMDTKDFFPDCYFRIHDQNCYFRGIIASLRTIMLKEYKKIIMFLGVAPRVYIELEWNAPHQLSFAHMIGIQGIGVLKDSRLLQVDVSEYLLF